MKVGLIDVDGHGYPNLPLMKISAFHKMLGDEVEWYYPLTSGHCDRVYMSKVFSFSPDYQYFIDADEIRKGGSGYCISLKEGREIFDKTANENLPDEIEHVFPDYSLYPGLTKNTAYGFLTRGCPRGCEFCHVSAKEGRKSYKVADLSEFWNGQKMIELLDPNIAACKDWEDLFWQLIQSGASVNFNQGVDIRVMTDEKIELFKKIKIKSVHFAWDRYEDKAVVVERLTAFRELTGLDRHKATVYILVNYNTTLEQDLERINCVRTIGLDPYVMVYDKAHTTQKDEVRRLQRWCNNKWIFYTEPNFEKYQ